MRKKALSDSSSTINNISSEKYAMRNQIEEILQIFTLHVGSGDITKEFGSTQEKFDYFRNHYIQVSIILQNYSKNNSNRL